MNLRDELRHFCLYSFPQLSAKNSEERNMSAVAVNKPFARRVRMNSTNQLADMIQEVDRVELPGIGAVNVKVVKGDFTTLPSRVQQFIARYVRSPCHPRVLFSIRLMSFCNNFA